MEAVPEDCDLAIEEGSVMAQSNIIKIKKPPAGTDGSIKKRNKLMSILSWIAKIVNSNTNKQAKELDLALAHLHGGPDRDEVKVITPDKARELIGTVHGRESLGRYIVPEPDGTVTAIDNSHGDAWTENFDRLVIAMIWLASEDITSDDARAAWDEIMQEDKKA